MTAASGVNHGHDSPAKTALRRCFANVIAALAIVARPARVMPEVPELAA